MKIGIVTGGGDCPGLNAAIRAVVKHGTKQGHSFVGFRGGFKGVVDADFKELVKADVKNIITRGGTMLGTGRFHPNDSEGASEAILENLEQEGIKAMICIGGDGTLYAASELAKKGVKIIGIPKTIDNDVFLTEYSIGYDTALNTATEAIDRLHTTAESHNRVMIVEVMGRTAGWIAANAGIAGGADVILTPEKPFDVDEVINHIIHRHKTHTNFSIVVVAEGAQPKKDSSLTFETQHNKFGAIIAGGISEKLKTEIENRTGFDTRVTVLGHIQRGGSPTPRDRVLASRFGVAAVDALTEGKTGMVTTLQKGKIILEPFEKLAGLVQYVPDDLLCVADKLR